MFGFSNVFHPTTCGGGGGGLPTFNISSKADDGGVLPTFKIYSKVDENLCLTVRDGDAVLAPADSSDVHQHWYKDKRFGIRVKDEEGKPAFSLINKATGLAVQHFGGPLHPVKLVRFDLDSFDNTIMWTLSNDLGNEDFGSIRTLNDISLKLAAFQGDHGITVKLSDSSDGDNHSWKVLPWKDQVNLGGQAMRLYCKANEGFSATACNGTVCLAPTNPNDEHQHWFEDTRYGHAIKDEDGYPAFALINRATGYAVERCEGREGPVKLVPYDPHYLDKSVLWSKSDDTMQGFHYIRTVDDICLNLDICDKYDGNKCHSCRVQAQDGTNVMNSYWCSECDNQYWSIVPWRKFSANQPGQDLKGSCGLTYARRRVKKLVAE